MAYLQRVPFKQVSMVADAPSVGHVILGNWPDWANQESRNYNDRAAFDRFRRRVRVDLAAARPRARMPSRPLVTSVNT